MHLLKWEYLPGKCISRRRNSRKMTLPPQKNMPVTPVMKQMAIYKANLQNDIKFHNQSRQSTRSDSAPNLDRLYLIWY